MANQLLAAPSLSPGETDKQTHTHTTRVSLLLFHFGFGISDKTTLVVGMDGGGRIKQISLSSIESNGINKLATSRFF